MDQPDPDSSATKGGNRRTAVIAGAGLLVLGALVGGLIAWRSTSGSHGAGTAHVNFGDGLLVFEERFSPQTLGWFEGDLTGQGSAELQASGYEITPPADHNDIVGVNVPFRSLDGGERIAALVRLPTGGFHGSGAGVGCLDMTSANDPLPFGIRAVVDTTGAVVLVTSDETTGLPKGTAKPAAFHDIALTCSNQRGGVKVSVQVDGHQALRTVVKHTPRGRWHSEIVAAGQGSGPAEFRTVRVFDPTHPTAGPFTPPHPDDGSVVLDGPPGGHGWRTTDGGPGFRAVPSASSMQVFVPSNHGTVQAPAKYHPSSAYVQASFSVTPDYANGRAGVGCVQTVGRTEFHYLMIAGANGHWQLSRIDTTAGQRLLFDMQRGKLKESYTPGPGPMTMGLACVVRNAGTNPSSGWNVGLVHLVGSVNGYVVVDTLDAAPGPLVKGWVGTIETGDGSNVPYTLDVTDFTIRKLHG